MGKFTEIWMVRHGEIDANKNKIVQGQNDVPLNELGLKQAESVGRRLKNRYFDAIYSSDLQRAAVTARCIAGDRVIIYTEKLREWHVGHMQGVPITEFKKLYPEEFAAYATGSIFFAPLGGERACDFFDRAAGWLSEMAQKHPGEKILCVTHGGFLRAVLKVVSNLERYPTSAVADNTCICCFRTGDNGKSWALARWNDTSHLEYDGLGSSGW